MGYREREEIERGGVWIQTMEEGQEGNGGEGSMPL